MTTGLDPISRSKTERGRLSHLKGAAAEELVLLTYEKRGAVLVEARWRGQGGEIDLIFLEQGTYVFCEVKASATVDEAVARLRPAQMQRIHASASEFLARTPSGQLSDVRFDLAVVDGTGAVTILDNAFGHF
ncbi:MAG: YraN family protein [Pseudomonadota bacterium]